MPKKAHTARHIARVEKTLENTRGSLGEDRGGVLISRDLVGTILGNLHIGNWKCGCQSEFGRAY